MGLVDVVVIILIVVALYLLVKWALAKLNIGVDQNLITIGAVILLILLLTGRVNLGL